MFGSAMVVGLTGLVAERAAADVTAATSVVVIGATTATREPIAHRTGGEPKSRTAVKHAAPRHQSIMAAQAVARAGEECHRRCCWHNPRCLARGPCSGCSAAAARGRDAAATVACGRLHAIKPRSPAAHRHCQTSRLVGRSPRRGYRRGRAGGGRRARGTDKGGQAGRQMPG